ncbi:MAG: transposase [Planctomycetaceae bacterium]
MDGLFRRRNLPHLDVAGGTYFVTFCLAGSLSASGALAIATRYRRRALHPPAGHPPSQWRAACAAEAFAAADRVLDLSPAHRWLADHRLARIVEEAILHRHGISYALLAYVVMPSHCHVVFTPLADEAGGRPAREVIVRSLKRHTAAGCNRVLGRTGCFWQPESFDRVIRGTAGIERVIAYVERNPVKAGLCALPEQWEFSSARSRPPPV